MGLSGRFLAVVLAGCLVAAVAAAQTPPPQGAEKPQSPEFVPISKKLCATSVALGAGLALSLTNLTLALLNQTSPPELPKTLQVQLCSYCDICISNECYTLKQPADGRRILQQQIRNSLGQLGGALSLQPEQRAQITPATTFALNSSLSASGANGGFISAPNTVDFVDLLANEFEKRVDIDAGLPDGFYEPQDMALSEDGDTLVVVSRGSDPQFFPNGPLPHLTIVNVPGQSVTKRVMLDPIDYPSHLVLSPDAGRAYVSSPLRQEGQFIDGSALVEVDLAGGRILRRLDLPFEGGGSGELVITPDGSQIVIILAVSTSSFTTPKLAVIDAATMSISAVFPTPETDFTMRRRLASADAKQLAMDPTGSRVYLSDIRALTPPEDTTTLGIAVFDMATARVTEIFPIPGKESGGDDDLQVYLDGTALVATDARTGSVFGIDAITGEVRFVEKIAETFYASELVQGL